MLDTLAINVLSDRTLEFVLPGGGKLTSAAVYFASAKYSAGAVVFSGLCCGRDLFEVQLAGLSLNGQSFSTASEAVIALNAVIGAGFRSGGGSSSTTPPITDYGDLEGKPSINSVTLSGNKTTADLGIRQVPNSGTEKQVLKRFHGPDNMFAWGSVDYNDLDNKPSIPTATVLDIDGTQKLVPNKTYGGSPVYVQRLAGSAAAPLQVGGQTYFISKTTILSDSGINRLVSAGGTVRGNFSTGGCYDIGFGGVFEALEYPAMSVSSGIVIDSLGMYLYIKTYFPSAYIAGYEYDLCIEITKT